MLIVSFCVLVILPVHTLLFNSISPVYDSLAENRSFCKVRNWEFMKLGIDGILGICEIGMCGICGIVNLGTLGILGICGIVNFKKFEIWKIQLSGCLSLLCLCVWCFHTSCVASLACLLFVNTMPYNNYDCWDQCTWYKFMLAAPLCL